MDNERVQTMSDKEIKCPACGSSMTVSMPKDHGVRSWNNCENCGFEMWVNAEQVEYIAAHSSDTARLKEMIENKWAVMETYDGFSVLETEDYSCIVTEDHPTYQEAIDAAIAGLEAK